MVGFEMEAWGVGLFVTVLLGWLFEVPVMRGVLLDSDLDVEGGGVLEGVDAVEWLVEVAVVLVLEGVEAGGEEDWPGSVGSVPPPPPFPPGN